MKSFRECAYFIVLMGAMAILPVAANSIDGVRDAAQAEKLAFLARHSTVLEHADASNAFDGLISDDSEKASSAIKKLKELKDEEMLLVALKYPNRVIKKEAAEALQEIAGKKSLAKICEALDYENKWLRRTISNAEIEITSRKFQWALLATIQKISGVTYDGPVEYSSTAITTYLDRVKEEMEKQK
ncbi:HEAT repeat domain-containing protein [Luteolibacter ambystomatis]|uniref:HEAT repeat domain-containing protein n=1 Tax=Luteolibacter ambystomatis TaxID=2824561 RepID=A0A975PGJ6_9BACT|nr:HEAT repeat domain-containing protein [Luteolibacter ambystomatis]QUE52794.1 HEAT repeat domain-containing protein [Luteolibacter ambystomatis]